MDSMAVTGATRCRPRKLQRRSRGLPAIGGLVVDDAGNLWVGSYEVGAATRRWRIISRTGQPIGLLELPAFRHPFVPGQTELLDVSGDRLAVRRTDPNGEVFVEVWTIRRP